MNQCIHFFTLHFPTASSGIVSTPKTLTNFIDPLTDFLEHDTGRQMFYQPSWDCIPPTEIINLQKSIAGVAISIYFQAQVLLRGITLIFFRWRNNLLFITLFYKHELYSFHCHLFIASKHTFYVLLTQN